MCMLMGRGFELAIHNGYISQGSKRVVLDEVHGSAENVRGD